MTGKEEFKNLSSEKEIHGKMITTNNLVSMGNSLLLDKEYELYKVFVREKRKLCQNSGIWVFFALETILPRPCSFLL